jgi:hypothetical protein
LIDQLEAAGIVGPLRVAAVVNILDLSALDQFSTMNKIIRKNFIQITLIFILV